MYSNRIEKPKAYEIMPLGVLSCLEGRWKNLDFSFLSVYRPPEGNDKTSLRALTTQQLGVDMVK
jgi:hypothetical protein